MYTKHTQNVGVQQMQKQFLGGNVSKRMKTYECSKQKSTESLGKREQTYLERDQNVGVSQSVGTVASNV